jgi:hypothetical protein
MQMTNDEMMGRIVVLEAFAMAALGLYLANSRNDPDFSKAAALLKHLKGAASSLAVGLPPTAKLAAEGYADHLVSVLTENLRAMRGEGAPPH